MLIAYNLRNPNLSFLYKVLDLDLERKTLAVEVVDDIKKVELGGEYELFINKDGHSFKVLGIAQRVYNRITEFEIVNFFENKRRFPRFKISVLNLFADVEIDNVTVPGRVMDFSLGGARIKFTNRNFRMIKTLLDKDETNQCVIKFQTPNGVLAKKEISITAAPVRISPEDRTVSFMFILDPGNQSVLKLYDYILNKMKFFVD